MPYAMRKIRGKDLFKVLNTETGEIKSSGSTKADAKSQLRLLRGLEKKEKKGGALKADQIKDVIDFSYNNKKDDAPKGYAIDKDLSDGRVKVYKDLNSNQVIVAHRGSSGWKDWLDNAYYATTGNIKDSGTYKTHKKKHEKALDKYGAENVISVGHSRAGKYVEELNREKPVKEVFTYNKAVGIHDAFQKNPENQTDIRSSRDLISGLSPFQRSKNKVVSIASNTFNPLKAHGTSALSSLGNKLIGKGFKQMRVGEMRKFVKAFKRAKYGENWTGGSKYNKKSLIDMIRPMMEDDDIDEMVGGSVWTDFVKEFSAKHSLKYACALSKYKEPLKKAYRLKKENKEWYEPFKIDAISGTDPVEKPKENISMTIEEPEPPAQEPSTQQIVVVPTKPIPKAYLKGDKNSIKFWLKHHLQTFDLATLRKLVDAYGFKPEDYRYNTAYKKDMVKVLEMKQFRVGENGEIIIDKKVGSGVMSGGNKWTDFVKDYAKKYDTTYGCALSDMNIKGAYKLFKDGKAWYFPKTSVIETQTDEIVEPEPTKAPENIKPVISRIEEKIKKLEKLGAEKGAVSYSPFGLITDIAFINMMKEHGGKCIVRDNVRTATDWKIGLQLNTDKKKSDTSVFQIKGLGEQLKECISRGVKLILIPLTFYFKNANAGHANMLIYRPFKRLIERYEPHGQQYGNSMVDNTNFNDQLKQLFEVDLKSWIGDVAYRQPDEYCPDLRGFQSLEGELDMLEQEGGGFCSMWSIFVAEMTFLNPDKSTKEILDEVYDISKSDPLYLKSVIRGYVVEAERGLDALLKELGKDGFTFAPKKLKPIGSIQLEQKAFDQIYQNVGELEAWLLKIIFDTKKFSEAPPMFEPLPEDYSVKKEKEMIKKSKIEQLSKLTIPQLKNIYGIYSRYAPSGLNKMEMVSDIVEALSNGRWKKSGAKDISDLSIIFGFDLYKEDNTGTAKHHWFAEQQKFS